MQSAPPPPKASSFVSFLQRLVVMRDVVLDKGRRRRKNMQLFVYK